MSKNKNKIKIPKSKKVLFWEIATTLGYVGAISLLIIGTNFLGLGAPSMPFPFFQQPIWSPLATAGAVLAGASVISTGVLENTVYYNERKLKKQMQEEQKNDEIQKASKELAQEFKTEPKTTASEFKKNIKEEHLEDVLDK
jgi:hypothetical protein